MGPNGERHGNQKRAYPLTTSRERLLPELISTGPPPFFRDGLIIRESGWQVNRKLKGDANLSSYRREGNHI
jgi:hypothetical protein